MIEYFSPILAEAGVIDYFVDSNFAGKLVIVALVLINCGAFAIIISKYSDLKNIRRANVRDEKRINELVTMVDYDDNNFKGRGSPYLLVCSRAMAAARVGAKTARSE